MDELIQSIYKQPGDWQVKYGTFNHSLGFKLWVANGFISCQPHESALAMTLIQKFKVWRAFKWWCKNAPINKTGGK